MLRFYKEKTFQNKKTRGAILRSKSQWHNEGEKKYKILPKLGKTTFPKKTIKHLTLANDNVVNTDSEILEEAKSFYQNLFFS